MKKDLSIEAFRDLTKDQQRARILALAAKCDEFAPTTLARYIEIYLED